MRPELRLLRLIRPYRHLLLLGLVTTLLASLLDGFTLVMLVPVLKHLFGTTGSLRAGSTQLEATVDRLVEPLVGGLTPGQAAARLVVLLVAGLVLKNVLSYTSTQISVRAQEGLVRDLRSRLFGHLLALDLGFFQRTRSGQLISGLITEVDQTKTVISASLLSFFQNLVVVAVTLVILSQISLRLTLLTLVFVPFLIFGLQGLIRRLRSHARARAHERGEITATAAERLAAIRLIRAYGEEDRETSRFAAQAERYRKRVIRTQRFSSLTSPVTEVFSGFLVILIIWAGTKPELVGLAAPLAPEAIIVFLMAALKLTSPLKTISSFPAVMAITMASAERVFEFLDQPPTEVDRPGEDRARFERDIAFDRVSFRYGDDDLVLRDVSFRLPKGWVVALVGPSGAGKTTLADLLPRFHDPTGGQVLMDGVPLTKLSRRSLRSLMGVVSQDTVLLNDTVRANIAYGSPGATAAQVEAAAVAANAAGFIAGLPDGYETMLGERGTRLSGGQRQRIAIARALLRDPPILILDEATSALDTESERLVQQAIERLMQERTVLVIAHRLATVRDADEIVVLEAGHVVQRGSHEELLRAGGLYRRLYDLQFRSEETEVAAEM
ncbi:MAG TPA: ABC transporter ATP-binding protein [Gemmatimonadales bacterium]|nr:ABC transporter ATP-binding protein [Gemmatimonadales bacterium]